MLETRTLLAGDAKPFISSGSFITNFDADPTSSQITIVGLNGGSLAIDSTLLPTTVRDLNLIGFETVTISGTDRFSSLDLARIGAFVGTGVDITSSLRVTEVGSVTLNTLGGFATLSGRETRLEVVDSRSATIYSTLERLTVSSQNDLMILSGNPKQEIRLEFQTGGSTILGPTLQKATEVPGANQTTSTEASAASEQIILPGNLATDALHTFTQTTSEGQKSYTVIIISLTEGAQSNEFLLRLQNAVKQGDAKEIKSAFAEFVRSIRMAGTLSYGIPLVAGTPVRVEVPAFSDAAERFSDHGSQTNIAAPGSASVELSNLTSAVLSVHVLGSIEEKQTGETESGVLRFSNVQPVTVAASDLGEQEQVRLPKAADQRPVLDQVRSSLSTLFERIDGQVSSVSAYIIDRFGDELEAGERPVLLVDAKPSRPGISRQFDWIEL